MRPEAINSFEGSSLCASRSLTSFNWTVPWPETPVNIQKKTKALNLLRKVSAKENQRALESGRVSWVSWATRVFRKFSESSQYYSVYLRFLLAFHSYSMGLMISVWYLSNTTINWTKMSPIPTGWEKWGRMLPGFSWTNTSVWVLFSFRSSFS